MTVSVNFSPRSYAPYGCQPQHSRGRKFFEEESQLRTAFARDRDRIIHSSGFRRLKDKTQVFVAHEGDYYRTRLTHSLEVAQIARTLAEALRLDTDLTETIALAHDLGHPPFGHAGEAVLQDLMAPFCGFDHNVQTFRLVTELERRYPAFCGLNLTWESLEGIAKHNGPIEDKLKIAAYLPIARYIKTHDIWPATYAGPEAQVAALSDDIAYNNHDIDDGLRAGLFSIKDLGELPLVGETLFAIRKDWPGLDERMLRLELIRRLIGLMVEDVLEETRRRLLEHKITSADAVRSANGPIVAFGETMSGHIKALRHFLTQKMYQHPYVLKSRETVRQILSALFKLYSQSPDALPVEWLLNTKSYDQDPFSQEDSFDKTAHHARQVCDYIAGMTDRFAIKAYQQYFSETLLF